MFRLVRVRHFRQGGKLHFPPKFFSLDKLKQKVQQAPLPEVKAQSGGHQQKSFDDLTQFEKDKAPYNDSFPLHLQTANPESHIWRVTQDKNGSNLSCFIIHRGPKNVKSPQVANLLRVLAPQNDTTEKFAVAWKSPIDNVSLHGIKDGQFKSKNMHRKNLENGKYRDTIFVNQNAYIMLPDKWIRSSALAYSIVVGSDVSEENSVIILKPESKFGKETYTIAYNSETIASSNSRESKPDHTWKTYNNLVTFLNDHHFTPSLIVIHVQKTPFTKPIVVGPIDSHEKLNSYIQYDITFTENYRASFDLMETSRMKHLSFAAGFPRRKIGTIRTLTWNVFNHREYGYRFLLQTSQHLLEKNHQKKIWETETLKFESDQRGRKWSERFQLTNEEIQITRPVFSPVFRVPELMNCILHSSPTLMCLQEVDVKIWSKYSNFLDENFGSFAIMRRTNDHLLTFWKKSAFTSVNNVHIPLGNIFPNDMIKKWLSESTFNSLVDNTTYSSGISILQPTSSTTKMDSSLVLLVNCHIIYAGGERYGLAFASKVYQVLRTLKIVDNLYQYYHSKNPKQGIQVIICGDYNEDLNDPKSFVKTMLQKGVYFDEMMGQIVSPTRLRFALSGGNVNSKTRYSDIESAKIDGIFFSEEQGTTLAGEYYGLQDVIENKIPHINHPSDHLPQLVDYHKYTQFGKKPASSSKEVHQWISSGDL